MEYLESGTYEWLGVNEAGCDSTAVLNLTILPSTESVDEPLSSCAPLEWNGMTLTASGTYTTVLTNEFGFDEVVTVEFTLLEATSSRRRNGLDSFT